mgnify:CR=1 FL=1
MCINKLNTMKTEIQKRRDELLVELRINVPQIEWEFQRVDEEIKYFNDGRTLSGYDIFYNGIHKESKDECYIKFDNGRLDVLELGYNHIPNESLGYQCENTNYKYIYDWDGVNEFFNEYCIGFEGREKKIKNGEMITPNMSRMKSVGTYETSKNEYSEGMLNLLLDNRSSVGLLKEYFNDFEQQYRELMKKTQSKEEYERFHKDKNSYYGTPFEMVLSYLEQKLEGEIEYWLEDKLNEVEEEVLETIKN